MSSKPSGNFCGTSRLQASGCVTFAGVRSLQYALVNLVCVLVWLLSGAQGDFWPKWVLVGTLVMYLRRLGRRTRRRELPPAGQRDGET
jgi:hypothetical protein